MAFELKYAHGLEQDAARERLVALGEYLTNKHGLGMTWLSDTEARVTGRYLVVSIDGTLKLNGPNAEFSGKDPGMLWRGKARDYLLGKLEKYLNPATPLSALPRR
jgi:hypothetical protein